MLKEQDIGDETTQPYDEGAPQSLQSAPKSSKAKAKDLKGSYISGIHSSQDGPFAKESVSAANQPKQGLGEQAADEELGNTYSQNQFAESI